MSSRVGVAALACLCTSGCALAFLSTADPRALVPYRLGGNWLGGAVRGVGPALSPSLFTGLMVAMLLAYALTVACADQLKTRWVLATAIALDVAFVLTPPLLSGDVVGYLIYARLGAVHGVDPYLHGTALTPSDPFYAFAKWRSLPTDYGPLFTAATYAVGASGLTTAIWVFKIVAGVSAVGASAMTRLASEESRSARALVVLALNPLLLVYGLGGGHNDLLTMLLVLLGMLALTRGRQTAGATAGVLAATVKLSGGLMLPFAFAGSRDRRRFATSLLVLALAVALFSVLVFGHGMTGYLDALHRLAQRASSRSFPGWLARHLGLAAGSGVTPGSRVLGELLFAGGALWLFYRTWHGVDWIAAAGWATLLLLLTTTWLLPWYIAWLLPFAALGRETRLQSATVAFTAWVVVVQLPALGVN
jgi:Glycosyltransferase family 87